MNYLSSEPHPTLIILINLLRIQDHFFTSNSPSLFLLFLAQGSEKKRKAESEVTLSSKWFPIICQNAVLHENNYCWFPASVGRNHVEDRPSVFLNTFSSIWDLTKRRKNMQLANYSEGSWLSPWAVFVSDKKKWEEQRAINALSH